MEVERGVDDVGAGLPDQEGKLVAGSVLEAIHLNSNKLFN